MTVIRLTTGEFVETGCIFDGHLGHYIGQEVIRLAACLGWTDSQAIFWADHYPDLPDRIILWVWDDAVDSAVTYLNSLTPDGYSYGCHDGEFFLLSDEEWEDTDY